MKAVLLDHSVKNLKKLSLSDLKPGFDRIKGYEYGIFHQALSAIESGAVV